MNGELRAACQQPCLTMVSAALGTAIVQDGEIAAWLDELFDGDPWPVSGVAWRGRAERLVCSEPGMLLAGLLARCDAALASRGRGEEVYLAPFISALLGASRAEGAGVRVGAWGPGRWARI